MTDYASFVDPAYKKRSNSAKLSIGFAIVTMIFSVAMLILTGQLDGLDSIRSFIMNSQAISQLVIQGCIIASLKYQNKCWILGICIIQIILALGIIISLGIVELAYIMQVYSGKAHILPAHPDSWFVLLDIDIALSFLSSFMALLTCGFALKQRNNTPDLIPRQVLKKVYDDNKDRANSVDTIASTIYARSRYLSAANEKDNQHCQFDRESKSRDFIPEDLREDDECPIAVTFTNAQSTNMLNESLN